MELESAFPKRQISVLSSQGHKCVKWTILAPCANLCDSRAWVVCLEAAAWKSFGIESQSYKGILSKLLTNRSKRESFPHPEHHSHCEAFQTTLPQSVPQSGQQWQKFKKPRKNHRIHSPTSWKLKSMTCFSKLYHAKLTLVPVLKVWKQERRNSESERQFALSDTPTSTFSKFTKAPVSCYLWPNQTQAMAKRIRA